MAIPLPAQYRLTQATTLAEDTGVAVDKTDDGATTLRDLYPQSYFDITAQIGPLGNAAQAALMAFLRTNRAAEISVPLRGVVYTCRIVKAPTVNFLGGALHQVTVGLRGRLA